MTKKTTEKTEVSEQEIEEEPFLKRILDRAEGKKVMPINEVTGEVKTLQNEKPFETECEPLSLAEAMKKAEDEVTESTIKKMEKHKAKMETQEIMDEAIELTSIPTTPKDHSCNTITHTKEKNEILSLEKIYQWSSNLTAEQKEEKYSWNPDTLMLRNRLMSLKGCFIACIGFQGSGKTALKQALFSALYNANKKVLSIKWGKKCLDRVMRDQDYEVNEVQMSFALQKLFDRYHTDSTLFTWSRICRKAGLKDNISYVLNDFMFGKKESDSEEEENKREVRKVFPSLFKLLTPEERRRSMQDNIVDVIQPSHTILIDLPDYSRQNINQLAKDLNDIGEFWENYILYNPEGLYEQRPNIVLFFQKELFKGHFLLGKMDTFEIKPLQPTQFLEIMSVQIGTIDPFTKKALLYLGSLSRGIFRRFKKYVRICLEQSIQHGCNSITVANTKQWISFEQLEKDMELELMTIFPKQKESRKASVKVLQLLREKGAILQADITKTVFENQKMKCSRILDKLEAWDYIERTWISTGEAHGKQIKLKESL